MAKIIINRKRQLSGSACNFDVYLMNTYIGELRSGQSLEITVEVGSYTLFFKSKNGLNKKTDTSFEAVVNNETEIIELNSKFTMNGFLVDYADNAPHIPTNRNESECIPINTDNDKKEINKTLNDIKKETKRTNGYLGGCLTIVIIIFIIGFISSTLLPTLLRSKTVTDVKTPIVQENEDNNKDKVLYSDDNFKITFVNLRDPKSGMTMYNMNLKLENNSKKNAVIYLSEAYVNDTAITFLGGNADLKGVASGKNSICAFMFGYADHDINDIEDIKKIEFKITLRNSDDFSDVLLSTDTITINFN